MGCTAEMMKCILNTVNVLLGLCGLAIIVVTGMALNENPHSAGMYMALTIGGFLFLASLLGCCGICQENANLTIAYAIIIGISFVLQLVQIFLGDKIQNFQSDAEATVGLLWAIERKSAGAMDDIQQQYKCCGQKSAIDYGTLVRTPPKSCYKEQVISPENLYIDGCIKAMAEQSATTQISDWICLAFTGVMVVFAIYLVKFFRGKQRRYNY